VARDVAAIRVGLIVGGASGIGEATAIVLGEQGWRVAVADLDSDGAEIVARELTATNPGTEAAAWTCDVQSRSSVDKTVAGVVEAFGQLDLIVPAAGYIDPSPSNEVTDESLMKMLDVHLCGAIRSARAAFQHLVASKCGNVVAVSSIAAHLGVPQRLAYNVAKGGIEAMVRTLAVEWASYGIRVNAVAPSWVLTPMIERAIESGHLNLGDLESLVPLQRLARPREIAETIAFLASPAASYVTGQSLLVDGATTIRGPWPSGVTAPRRESDED
jgi:NAD(P)-dependent dehydrogenase (short-subunit alcohol dehydrogenase family)